MLLNKSVFRITLALLSVGFGEVYSCFLNSVANQANKLLLYHHVLDMIYHGVKILLHAAIKL